MFVHERHHRLPRPCYRGLATVSFTACIESRRTPFLVGTIVESFLGSLRESVNKNHCVVLIYCFMPDHMHVMLHGEDESADIWRAMVDFKQKTGYGFGQNRPEFEWQKDFHDHVIRQNEDLAAHVRYFADNPVRRGLVKVWSEYPYTRTIGFALNEILADVAAL